MAITLQEAGEQLKEKVPEDHGVDWLLSRLGFVAGERLGIVPMDKAYPDASTVHLRLLEQWQHMRDCPTYPGWDGFSDEARLAAFDLAELFATEVELPVEVIQGNWLKVADNAFQQ